MARLMSEAPVLSLASLSCGWVPPKVWLFLSLASTSASISAPLLLHKASHQAPSGNKTACTVRSNFTVTFKKSIKMCISCNILGNRHIERHSRLWDPCLPLSSIAGLLALLCYFINNVTLALHNLLLSWKNVSITFCTLSCSACCLKLAFAKGNTPEFRTVNENLNHVYQILYSCTCLACCKSV